LPLFNLPETVKIQFAPHAPEKHEIQPFPFFHNSSGFKEGKA
jgi:hypothetical protein